MDFIDEKVPIWYFFLLLKFLYRSGLKQKSSTPFTSKSMILRKEVPTSRLGIYLYYNYVFYVFTKLVNSLPQSYFHDNILKVYKGINLQRCKI
ncbi:hypothetical protein COA01_30025 [Bacillus cereus]|nr:hypothetical protein COA01_30025 [Bacillus cereus]